MTHRSRVIPTAFVLLLGLAAAPALRAQQAQAQPAAAQPALNDHLYDKFQLDLSGSLIVLSSTFRVDGDNGQGTDIEGESVLGLPSTKFQPRAALRWRPGKRHEFEVGYQMARRKGTKTLADSLVFGDTTYAAGADVHSIFNTDQAFLTYRYAFIAHPRTQVGFGIGLGAFFFKINLDAVAQAAGGGDSVTYSTEKSFTGPTGSVGFYGRFLSGRHWQFEADARAIVVKLDRLKAGVAELGGAVRYSVSHTVGLELGYGISAVKVEVFPKEGGVVDNNSDFQSGRVKFHFQNFRLGVVLSL